MKNVEVQNPRVGLNKKGKTKTFLISDLLYKTFNIDYTNNESFENEIWVDIKDFKDMYQISNYGRVRSLDRYVPQADYMRFMKGKILSTKRNNGGGYVNVSLQYGHDVKPKNYYLHILVAEHFLENPNNYTEVNHIDFNKANNKVENLEWCHRQENIEHLVENRSTHFITKELKSKVKDMYSQDFDIDEISVELNIEYSVVKQILNILKRSEKAKENKNKNKDLRRKKDLLDLEVDEIRNDLLIGTSKKDLASKYDCGYWTVDSINRKL